MHKNLKQINFRFLLILRSFMSDNRKTYVVLKCARLKYVSRVCIAQCYSIVFNIYSRVEAKIIIAVLVIK